MTRMCSQNKHVFNTLNMIKSGKYYNGETRWKCKQCTAERRTIKRNEIVEDGWEDEFGPLSLDNDMDWDWVAVSRAYQGLRVKLTEREKQVLESWRCQAAWWGMSYAERSSIKHNKPIVFKYPLDSIEPVGASFFGHSSWGEALT